jgi:hypothetical protein
MGNALTACQMKTSSYVDVAGGIEEQQNLCSLLGSNSSNNSGRRRMHQNYQDMLWGSMVRMFILCVCLTRNEQIPWFLHSCMLLQSCSAHSCSLTRSKIQASNSQGRKSACTHWSCWSSWCLFMTTLYHGPSLYNCIIKWAKKVRA